MDLVSMDSKMMYDQMLHMYDIYVVKYMHTMMHKFEFMNLNLQLERPHVLINLKSDSTAI